MINMIWSSTAMINSREESISRFIAKIKVTQATGEHQCDF